MPAFWRSMGRISASIFTFPLAFGIDRLLRQSGVGTGMLILTFIFVNFNWVLPSLAMGLRELGPGLAVAGSTLSTGILLLLGDYFYAFPLGACACLLRLAMTPGPKPEAPLFKTLDYLFTIVPITVWVFTFFSYKIAASLKLFPTIAPPSLFEPANFSAYLDFYLPFWDGEADWWSPETYFALWGLVMGWLGSQRILMADFNSRRQASAVRHALHEPWHALENQSLGLLLIYTLLVGGFIYLPLALHPGWAAAQLPLRAGGGVFLLLPVLFHAGLRIYRRVRGVVGPR